MSAPDASAPSDPEKRGAGDLGLRVSVIVCTYTEERWTDVLNAIDSLRRQVWPPSEIILVVDHNPQLLARAREALRSSYVVPNAGKRGLSGSRNTGVAASNAELVAFLDDDAIADPLWLARLVRCCAEENALGVSSKVDPIWPGFRPAWLADELLWIVGCSHRGLPTVRREVRNLLGTSMLVRRRLFEQVGAFDTSIGRRGTRVPISCEETELCLRASSALEGSRFILEPVPLVRHKVAASRLTWGYLWLRCYAEGLSKAYLRRTMRGKRALDMELGYVKETLLPAFRREALGFALHGDLGALQRSVAIAVALAGASIGLMIGSIRTGGRMAASRARAAAALGEE